ncbi:hemerythrin domain-containing protein [Streptomyces sp. NPDC020983]|uniref:hemerythrin domain-containing protein n=1 Tax=Streptomyces sp. NPDC020983 TaxID=3365106 RepID=UPI0037936E57
MTDTQADRIDFTIMYATHRAFRRDLQRLAAAAESGRGRAPQALAGWDNFSGQLHHHHSVEDAALWPQVEAKIAGRPEAQQLMKDMEAEHAELGPRIDAVDAALHTTGADLAARIEDLYQVMDDHFRHEEDSALPLIQEVLTRAEWKKFGLANARKLGLKGVATYIPWVLDGSTPAQEREFLGAFPPPVRAANKLFWQRSYARKGLWRS